MRLAFQLISLINMYAAVPITHNNSSDSLKNPQDRAGETEKTEEWEHVAEEVFYLILFIIAFSFVVRCFYYECHCRSFFGTYRKKFPFQTDPIQYPARYELNSNQPTFVRKPLTTSISFEICSTMHDKLTLRGCNPMSPDNYRDLTIVFPIQTNNIEEKSVSVQRRNTKIVDDQGNRLASYNFGQRITTDTWGLKSRNYLVSWNNDVLRCKYQGNEVLTMADLSGYFSTPKGRTFVQGQGNGNFIITDIFATSSHQVDVRQHFSHFCDMIFCDKFCMGNMRTSKWGFQTES